MSREPSMEEILSSIRRVIARDEAGREGALETRFGPEATQLGSDEDGDDVLDLTQVDADEPTTIIDTQDIEPELVSPVSVDAARQSINQLAAALAPDPDVPAAMSATSSGVTIEALAEAALKPLLKEWLDANLPTLVERLVAREIARITGGRI
jgi:uncharacterized protein